MNSPARPLDGAYYPDCLYAPGTQAVESEPVTPNVVERRKPSLPKLQSRPKSYRFCLCGVYAVPCHIS